MADFKLKKCKTKKGYRIQINENQFSQIKQKIKQKFEPDLETPHLIIFNTNKTKISISHKAIVLRNCTKNQAIQILKKITTN